MRTALFSIALAISDVAAQMGYVYFNGNSNILAIILGVFMAMDLFDFIKNIPGGTK